MLRKTIYSLVGTLRKIFFDKLFKTKENGLQSLFLIERCLEFISKIRRITLKSFNDSFFVPVQSNIPVVPTIVYKDTTMFLVTAAKQLQKEWLENAIIRHRYKSKTLKNKQLYAVTRLPCVDSELAENIIKKLVRVRTVFYSSKEEFLQVDGIGSLSISGIVEILDAPNEEEKTIEWVL